MIHHGRQHQKNRGFTLIEISAVVLLIALVLTTVAVRLDNYLPNTRSESAARQLLAVMDLARTSAVAQGHAYEVEIYITETDGILGGRYRIRPPFDNEGRIARDPEDRAGMKWNELSDGVEFEGVLTSSGLLQDQGIFRMRFSQVGSADEVYIYLKNQAGDGYTLTVRVQALTGASKVIAGRYLPTEVTEDDF